MQLTSVRVTRERNRGENILALRIRHSIISTNTPANKVILAGAEQTVMV